MKTAPAAALVLLAALSRVGWATPAADPAARLAVAMRQAGYSEGFEARLSISAVTADGQRSAPVKLAVIGQADAERQRVLVRGISPDTLHGDFVAAERRADGSIKTLGYAAAHPTPIDVYAKVFGSRLVLWDLLSPWWGWPNQVLAGESQIAGRGCTLIRSQNLSTAAPIREALSCVDKSAGLALQTQLFDTRHQLVRTLSVAKLAAKDAGGMLAKKLLITDADHAVSEAELYSGDEHYTVTESTFPTFGFQPHTGK